MVFPLFSAGKFDQGKGNSIPGETFLFHVIAFNEDEVSNKICNVKLIHKYKEDLSVLFHFVNLFP